MPDRDLRRQWAGLCKRFSMDRRHAEHVADLCGRLFAELPHLHGLTKTCRGLVEAAALLHDIAEAGGKVGHEARGARRLLRARIPGLPDQWKPILAQAIRLHSTRSDLPAFLSRLRKRSSPPLEIAARVAAILRIGDGLDHCRRQDTHIAAILDDGQAVEIVLAPAPGAEENARFALRKADLWNHVALRPIRRIAPAVAEDAAAEPSPPPARQPVAEVGRQILQRQFELFASRRYGAGYWADPEYVHEMRVAARRLRSAIEAMKKHLGGRWKELGKRMSGLGERLGGVRDMDVFMEYLQEYSQEAPRPHRPILRAVLADRSRQREAARQELCEAIRGQEYQDAESCWRLLLRPLAVLPSAGRRRQSPPAWREAKRSLRQYLERLLEHGRNLKKLSPPRQHLVRIDCKKLRYLAECFECFYGRGLRDIIKIMVELQDLLGQVHDSYVYADWLQEEGVRLGGQGEAAIGALLDHLGQERRECLLQAGKIWKRFTGRRSRKRLVRIIESPRKV